jgi:hypothetical protein
MAAAGTGSRRGADVAVHGGGTRHLRQGPPSPDIDARVAGSV